VIKTKSMGKILMHNKKSNFLSLKLILNLIFFTSNQIKNKNGINIPNCLNRKIIGYFKWLKISESSKPVLFKPYKIVMKSLLKSQIR